MNYGQIVLFVLYPQPCAVINETNIVQESSLTQQAGSTTHPKLTKHQRADILNNLILVVTPSKRIIKVDLKNMKKAIVINVISQQYISAMVNQYKHH